MKTEDKIEYILMILQLLDRADLPTPDCFKEKSEIRRTPDGNYLEFKIAIYDSERELARKILKALFECKAIGDD